MATRDISPLPELEAEQPNNYDRLRRFILYHLGGFTLGLVRVNDPHQRDGVIASLIDNLIADGARLIRVDVANRFPENLRQAIRDDPDARVALETDHKHAALAIAGMEHLIEAEAHESGRPPFAAALNAERDALPQALPVPLILFLTDHAMDRLDLAAPDFFDWYSGIFRFRPVHGPEAPAPSMQQVAEPPPSYSTTLSSEAFAARLDLLEERRAELARTGERLRLAQVLKEIGDLYAGLPEYHHREAAISYLKQAREIFHEESQKSDEAAVLEQLGEVCYWINDYEQAVRRYEAALPLYREIGARLGEANCIRSLGDVHVRLSEYALARQRYEAALPLYREIGARLGEANSLTAFGDVALAEEDNATARERFEQAWGIYREIGERHWRTYVALRLARALLALNDRDEAQRILEEGAELARQIDGQPNLKSILWLLTQILEAKEDFVTALGLYNELLSLAPDDSDYVRGRARVRFELKNYQRALSDYQHLLKLNARDAWAYNGIGSVLEREGDLEGAVAAYSQAIAIDANEAAFVRNRASTLIALSRLEEAREDCEIALRLAPDHSYTQGRWGDLHLARGEWAAAEARYRAALAQDDSPGWHLDLAVSLWGLGRLDEGWTEFETALEKADEDTRTETLKEYRRLLARHPALPGIAEAIERLTQAAQT